VVENGESPQVERHMGTETSSRGKRAPAKAAGFNVANRVPFGCRHQSLPLDFGDAHYFDEAYDALVCCHHGARYRPESGECFAGPCLGGRLTPLVVEERDGALWCVGAAR
jgi:hypothetical protein